MTASGTRKVLFCYILHHFGRLATMRVAGCSQRAHCFKPWPAAGPPAAAHPRWCAALLPTTAPGPGCVCRSARASASVPGCGHTPGAGRRSGLVRASTLNSKGRVGGGAPAAVRALPGGSFGCKVAHEASLVPFDLAARRAANLARIRWSYSVNPPSISIANAT